MMAFGQHRTRIWSQNNALIPWISLLLGYLLCLMGITEALAEVFPEFSEQPQSQVFSHHSPVTLRCAATPEDAQIRWLFNGQPLDERRHTNLIVQGSNLHFSYIHRHADQHSDLGEYRCTATTSLGTVISQPAILSKPVLGTFSPSPDVKVTVPEGGYATLTCDPPASNPPAKIVFQTSRGDFVNTTRDTVHPLPSGNLVITNITSSSGTGDYRCVAVNPASGHNVTSTRVISLQIDRSNSEVKLMPGMKRKVQVAMGADVSLECPSYGQLGGNITWSKTGGSLPIGRFNLTSFGNINIESVQYEDTGTYRCQSSSGSDSVVLEVFTIPVVQVVRQPGKSVHVGDRVEFVCSYGGLPKPSLRWYHNGRELDSGSEGNLVLTKVSTADSGIYQCIASNIMGTKYGVLSLLVNAQPRVIRPTAAPLQETETLKPEPQKSLNERMDRKKNGRRKKISLRDKRKKKKQGKGHQVETEKPKYAPSVPTVTQLSDRSVMLNWTVPDPGNGQTIRFFKVQYKEMHTEKSNWHTSDAHLPPDARRFEVVNLKLGASYKFRVLAVYEDDDNKNSPSTTTFRLTIVPHAQARPPETAPMIVEATPVFYQETYGIGVKWQYKPETASPIEGFIIIYKPYGTDLPDMEKRVPGAGVRSEVIRDLLPNTDYSIQMQSFNMAGNSQLSNLVVKKTKAKGNGTEKTTFNPDTPATEPEHLTEAPIPDRRSGEALEQPVILGIVLGALLLALFVLVTMCWWKQRQQKRRNLCNSSAQQKFQEQSRCIFTDNIQGSKPNGNLYPSNGSIPAGNGHGPPRTAHSHMNIDVNPLAEYDVQTSAHGDSRPKQFYGNGGVNGVLPRCSGDKICKEMSCQHSGSSHASCNGDMAYMEYPKPTYPMQHRTLPLTPNQPLHTFYSEAGSLGRSVHHEYSEPGDHERLHSGVPHSLYTKQTMAHPSHVNGQVRNFDYNWSRAYDQPCMDKSSHVSVDRLSPCYPAPADFAGNHPMFGQQHKRLLPTSPSSHMPSHSFPAVPGPLVGSSAGLHVNGKHKRRRKRPNGRDPVLQVHGMKDQATNTDLSSNAYCHTGSSSGSDICGKHCDSSFANNGSLESLEDDDDDSQSAISLGSHDEQGPHLVSQIAHLTANMPSQCDILNR
ncbi:interference hedgehog-like isoform X2 [Biomphalaria glabrata]|uniref:Interference hedgehog-like isoform X2 n=1 Tax=Biomphalaria glabrata TaxID=6526 RepID=A0A9W2YY59_BIOGL|nr:interference hedgehog-like isoform X2 [Biomphalaria glabrata]